jgi:hypothetical protein
LEVTAMLSLRTCRRFALTSAALLILVAMVVATGVIPAVGSDTYPHATPQSAVPAFWINVGLNVLGATILGLLAFRARGRNPLTTTVLVLWAFLALLLAIALADAASAYRSHGLAMRTATILLFLCSAIEALAAVLIITTAIRFPRIREGAQQAISAAGAARRR